MKNPFEKEIEKKLRFDPLDEAEKITGKSYKDDPSTSSLGMLLLWENGKAKDDILELFHDSTFSMGMLDYIKVVESLGFENVGEYPFEDEKYGKGETEVFLVYWHPEYSILLDFDSYGGRFSGNRNSSQFYYNWLHNPDVKGYDFISSGSWIPVVPETDSGIDQLTLSGYHDGIEAINHKITRLSENGTFLKQWIENPGLHLNHWMDWEMNRIINGDSYDFSYSNEESEKRINQLPQKVKECISPQSKVKFDYGIVNIEKYYNFGNELSFDYTYNNNVYMIKATVFKNSSDFGINKGRVSKLQIRKKYNWSEDPIFEFNRGEFVHNSIDKEFLDEIVNLFPSTGKQKWLI